MLKHLLIKFLLYYVDISDDEDNKSTSSSEGEVDPEGKVSEIRFVPDDKNSCKFYYDES